MVYDEPLHVEFIEGDALAANAELFLSTDFTAQFHLFALYADVEFYQRQFQGLDRFSPERAPLLSLVGVPQVTNGIPKVPLAVFPEEITPSSLQSLVTSMPVLTITTLSFAQNRESQGRQLGQERSFIIIDRPLSPQVQRWADRGWTIRFVIAEIEGESHLRRITLTVDELPQCLFVAFCTNDDLSAFALTIDRRRLGVFSNLELDNTVGAEIDAVSAHFLKTCWKIPSAA